MEQKGKINIYQTGLRCDCVQGYRKLHSYKKVSYCYIDSDIRTTHQRRGKVGPSTLDEVESEVTD